MIGLRSGRLGFGNPCSFTTIGSPSRTFGIPRVDGPAPGRPGLPPPRLSECSASASEHEVDRHRNKGSRGVPSHQAVTGAGSYESNGGEGVPDHGAAPDLIVRTRARTAYGPGRILLGFAVGGTRGLHKNDLAGLGCLRLLHGLSPVTTIG